MNPKQEIVAVVALVVIIGMVLVPACGDNTLAPLGITEAGIDWLRLVVQVGVVLIVAAILLLVFRERRNSWIRKGKARRRDPVYGARVWILRLIDEHRSWRIRKAGARRRDPVYGARVRVLRLIDRLPEMNPGQELVFFAALALPVLTLLFGAYIYCLALMGQHGTAYFCDDPAMYNAARDPACEESRRQMVAEQERKREPEPYGFECGFLMGLALLVTAALVLAFRDPRSGWIRRRAAPGLGPPDRPLLPVLNSRQRIVVVAAALVIVAMLAVPPWAQYVNGTDRKISFYFPVFLPMDEVRVAHPEVLTDPVIDTPRLGGQIAVVATVAALLLLVFLEQRRTIRAG